MSKTSKIILITIVATCLLLGLGYAAITNITLNIAGTASATADSGNFKVRFVGTPVVSDGSTTTAKITTDHEATIEVDGLTSAGQYVTATYEIKNESSDLSADLKVDTSNDNTEYFKISSKLDKSSLKANETTTVLVTVELTKTPIDADVSAKVGVELTAMPVQPGEEGTSAGNNSYSETPRELNEYGFYFDEAYMFEISEDMVGVLIFAEDGSYEVYINDEFDGYYPAGSVTYGEKTITAVGVENENATLQVSDDGTQLSVGEELYVLDESYMDRFDVLVKNEYGFYYEQPYSGIETYDGSSQLVTYIFYEDGYVERYSGGIYYGDNSVMNINITYSENKIVFGETELIVAADGRVIGDDSLYVGIDFTFYDRYGLGDNNYYGIWIEDTNEWKWIKTMPATSRAIDILLKDDYTYICRGEDWTVGITEEANKLPEEYVLIDKNKESYGPILDYINEMPVTMMNSTFLGCTNLKIAPEIPSTVTNIDYAFENCTSLTSAPIIPSSVTKMTSTFNGCISLTGDVVINTDNVTYYDGCFSGVDMTNINLTGSASVETLNKLGATGNNYVEK